MYVCELLCKWPGRMPTKAVRVYSFYKWRESGIGDKTQRESQGYLRKCLILFAQKRVGVQRGTHCLSKAHCFLLREDLLLARDCQDK